MDNNTIIRVIENVKKLLINRGHDDQQLNNTMPYKYMIDRIDRFMNNDPTSLDIFINSDKKVYVKFLPKLDQRGASGIKYLENIYKILSNAYRINENDEIIFVILDIFDKEIHNIEYLFQNVTVFNYKQLLSNIVDNVYVPKHSRLTRAEKNALKKTLMIDTFDKLPLIQKTDAVCRYYNFREGDVLKIERPSIGSKTHVVYRYVVSDTYNYQYSESFS